MRDFSSNLDEYYGSRGILVAKSEGESSKERNMESKTILEALGQSDGNRSEKPTPTKMDITNVKSLIDSKIEKNDEGKALFIKNQCLNKENQKEMMEQKDLNIENQLHLKETQEITNDSEKKIDEEIRDENNLEKLSFLYKDKLKVDAFLQVDSQLYNEIIVLKKEMGEILRDLDQEKMKRTQLENQVGNTPKKLKEYEMKLQKLVKDSRKKMEMVTSILCLMASSIRKKRNEEIMSLDVVTTKIMGGSSK